MALDFSAFGLTEDKKKKSGLDFSAFDIQEQPTIQPSQSIPEQRASGLAKFGITEPEGTEIGISAPPTLGGRGLGFEFSNPAFGPPTTVSKALARDISVEAKNRIRGGTFEELNADVDHIVPVSLGGTKADYNLQGLSNVDKRQEGKYNVEISNINKWKAGQLTQGQAIYNILQYSWANEKMKKKIEEQAKASNIFKTAIQQINKESGKAFDFLEKTVGQVPDKILDVVSGVVGTGAALVAQLPIEIYSQATGKDRRLGEKMEDFINTAKETSQLAKSTIVGGIEMTPYIATELVKTTGAIAQGVGGNEDAMIDRMADVYIRHQLVGEQLGYQPASREEIKQLLLSNTKEGNIAALVALGGMALDLLPLKEIATYGIEKGLAKLPQQKSVAVNGQNISATQLSDFISGRKPLGKPLTPIQNAALKETNITGLRNIMARAKAGKLSVVQQKPTFANLARKPMSQLFKQSVDKFKLNIPEPISKVTGTPLIEGKLGAEHIKSFKDNASKQILDTTRREVGEANARLFSRYINEADLSSAKTAAQLESLALKAVGKNAPSTVISSIKNWAKSIEQIRFYGGVEGGKGVTTPSKDITIKAKVPSVEVKPPSKVAPITPIKPKVVTKPKVELKVPEKGKIEPETALLEEAKKYKTADEFEVGGRGEKISFTKQPQGEKSVVFFENKIKAGERPVVTIGKTSSGNFVVVDGNHTLNAYKNLGIDKIPFVKQKTSISPAPQTTLIEQQEKIKGEKKVVIGEAISPFSEFNITRNKESLVESNVSRADTWVESLNKNTIDTSSKSIAISKSNPVYNEVIEKFNKGKESFVELYNTVPARIESLASIISGLPNNPKFTVDVKSPKSVLNKIIRKRTDGRKDYWIKDINDFVRGMAIYKNPRAMQDAISSLGSKVIKMDDFIKEPTKLGYRGVNIDLRLDDGSVAELQLHTKETLLVKQKLDIIYEPYRGLEIIPVKKIRESKKIANDIIAKANVNLESLQFKPKPENRVIGEAMQFYSANISEEVNWTQAKQLLKDSDQKRMKLIAENIDARLGLNSKTFNVLGDTKEWGTENSYMSVITNGKDIEKVRYSNALKGAIFNQKAVLNMSFDPNGKDLLHEFKVINKSEETLRKDLNVLGLEYRTLQPIENGYRVYIFDEGGKLNTQVEKLTKKYGIKQFKRKSTGEFIGGETRIEGLKEYRQVIEKYESKHKGISNTGLTRGDSDTVRGTVRETITQKKPEPKKVVITPKKPVKIIPKEKPTDTKKPITIEPIIEKKAIDKTLPTVDITQHKGESFSTHFEKIKEQFGFEGAVEIDRVTNKEQARLAFNFIQRNPEGAMKIAYGFQQHPNAQAIRQSLVVSLLEAGKKAQADEIAKLVSKEFTKAAQTLNLAKADLGADRAITKSITNARLQKLGESLGGKPSPEEAIIKAKRKVKQEASTAKNQVVEKQATISQESIKKFDSLINDLIC